MAEYSNYQTQLQGDAMDTLNKLANSQKELETLQARKQELMQQLNTAHRVLVVWREAFKDGMTCSIYRKAESVKMRHVNNPGGLGNGWEYTCAILERKDGEKRAITLEQYDLIEGNL